MKNIIFDFGNVIINFNSREVVSHFTDNKEVQDFLINEVIYSPEWNKYGFIDSGFITHEEVSILINDRTNNIYQDLVNYFMKNYYKYMYIQKEVIEIIKGLKEKGYNIYLLSNTNEFIYEKFIKEIEYLFDGIVLSYRKHILKPHDSIYQYIIAEYNLNPEESLFIDDREDNVKTANKFGIKGRNVKPDDVEDIKRVLKEYGIGE